MDGTKLSDYKVLDNGYVEYIPTGAVIPNVIENKDYFDYMNLLNNHSGDSLRGQ